MTNKHIVDITIIWPDDAWEAEVEQEYLLNCLKGIKEHFQQYPIKGHDHKLTLTNSLGRVYAEVHVNPVKETRENFHSGWIKCEAIRLARKDVKAEMMRQGIKVTRVKPADITRAAKTLLIEHRDEYLKQAEENYKARPTTSYIRED